MIELPVVPDSLGELSQWILWSYEFVPDKDDAQKIPYSARTRRKASTTNPRDWSSFSYCASVWRAYPWNYSGLGFVFTKDDPFCGIDLDDCLDDAGNPKPWAQPIVERFANTYMEVSPGGRGIKIWAKAALEKAMVEPAGDGSIEMYSWGRYFCVTGRRWRNAALEIEGHQAAVQELFQRLARPRTGSYDTNGTHPARGAWPVNPAADGLIHKNDRHHFLVSLAGTLRRRHVLPEIIESCLVQVNQKMLEQPTPYTPQDIRKIVEDAIQWQ
jgi:hypothetical protein